ncbi:MAG: Cysteine desulfuration protein SufE [Ignavibacteria bacterium]|nr:Cysteine desulfuration protein SufE [Ignavibacteria bacterium]
MSESNIKNTEKEIIDEFELFNDWIGKYEYIIELGKKLPLIDENLKNENYEVKGCQSKVWINADYKDGYLFFKADSDALITKGIISLLIRVLSGNKPDEILNADMNFINEIGLKEHLSPNRANGLNAMISKMKNFAMVYSNQNVN